MLKKCFRWALFIIPVAIIANILFSLYTTDKNVWEILRTIPYTYLLVAILLGLVPWLTSTLRVLLWTRFLGKKIPLFEIFKIVIGTQIGSAISPTAIGGGYVKLGMLIQKGLSPGAAASLMTLGSVEDAIFFAIALPVALFFASDINLSFLNTSVDKIVDQGLISIICLILIIGMVTLLFKFRKTRIVQSFAVKKPVRFFFQQLKRLYSDFVFVYTLIGQKGKTRFFITLSLAAVQWTCRYSVITVLLACFDVPIHPVEFFIFQWMVFTLATFIPTPGGAVGAEAAFFLIYSGFIPREIIGIATLGWRFLTYYLQLGLGSILFSFMNLKAIWRNLSNRKPGYARAEP